MVNNKHRRSIARALVFLLFFQPALPVAGDIGVLLPVSNDEAAQEPNPLVLALDSADVAIEIDEGFARVRITEIFANRTNQPSEGEYRFLLPPDGAIADFAIWEDGVRIPGVILEKKKAWATYQAIKSQMLDPGILSGAEEAAEARTLRARVAPIPAYGTKRIETTWTAPLSVADGKARLRVPLRPDYQTAISARTFRARIHVADSARSGDIALDGLGVWTRDGDNLFLTADNLPLDADIVLTYPVGQPGITLSTAAYRDPAIIHKTSPIGGGPSRDPWGYVRIASTLRASEAAGETLPPRDVVAVFDASLSMRGPKLDRAFECVADVLKGLGPDDRFALLLVNREVIPVTKGLVPSSAVDSALNDLRSSFLASGSDLSAALREARDILVSEHEQNNRLRSILLVTDGRPTQGEVLPRALEAAARMIRSAGARLDVYSVGRDADAKTLERLAVSTEGTFAHVDDNEATEATRATFLSRMRTKVIRDLDLKQSPEGMLTDVYRFGAATSFDGGQAIWVGRYRTPGRTKIMLKGTSASGAIEAGAPMELPEVARDHPDVRRQWAQARVEYLIRRIEVDGERPEWVDEIIALAREYNLSTPYTAFLAAPRALLRPRVIRPGDPVIRVRCDSSVVAVTALLPENRLQPLRYDAVEDVWEARFLAPRGLEDGKYPLVLVLENAEGRTTRIVQKYVIDQKAPELDVELAGRVAPGGEVEILVRADADVRRIRALIDGASACDIVWDKNRKASIGRMLLPSALPPGKRRLIVIAEDFARNVASRELEIEVGG